MGNHAVIAVVQSDIFCTLVKGAIVVVVGATVVVEAGTVVVGAIVVVVGVVRTAVIGATASVSHSSLVADDVTTPRSKMGAIAMTDKLWVDDRTTRTSAVPAMIANKAKSPAMIRPVFPPVMGKSQT